MATRRRAAPDDSVRTPEGEAPVGRKRGYRSDALAAAHQTIADLHAAGLADKTTMRVFDAACLEPLSGFDASRIRSLRRRLNLSQPVFAAYLNVGKSTVAQWEAGTKRPSGPAVRLLDLLDRKGLEALS
ncbi:MAG: helix-turn-helix domain-containing protein [Azospirillaceae bacterium]